MAKEIRFREGLHSGIGLFGAIRFLFRWVGMFMGIAIAFFIIITPISMIYQNNILTSYYYDKVTDPLLNTGAGNFLKKGLNTLTVPFNEEKQIELLQSYTWKSTIDENSKKQDLGLKITSFRARNDIIPDGENVEAVAEGYASTTEPTEIEFLCLTGENKLGEVANQNNILTINPNIKEYFAIKCVYDKGSFELDTTETSESKKIKIRATYDFTTEAYLPIYILQKDVLDYKREEENKGPVREEYNIFEDENIFDSNLNKAERTTSSAYTKGPVKLILRSLYTQPYTEEGPFESGSSYTLDIKIDDDMQWTGNIEEIESFEILTSEEVSLITENFEPSRNEENFQVYRATDSLLNQLKERCKPKNIIEGITKYVGIEEECWRSGNMVTSVEFSIDNPSEEIEQTFIRSRLRYKFNDEKQDTITFIHDQNA